MSLCDIMSRVNKSRCPVCVRLNRRLYVAAGNASAGVVAITHSGRSGKDIDDERRDEARPSLSNDGRG